jgi:hypothetical protein
LLLNIVSEVGSTQVRVCSFETKETEWPDDVLLFTFNKAYKQLKIMVEKDIEINIFKEIMICAETGKIITSELETDFTIEIPEDTQNYKKLSVSLFQIGETQDLFSKCKDMLFKAIGWGNPALEINYYSILKVIDYLYSVANVAVVTGKNNEYLSKIRNAFTELKNRTITHNHNYQTILTFAQQDIYSLEFPKFFKSNLPYNNEIGKVLNDIR